MNERTLELALQAGLKKDHGSDREYIGDFDWREFSRLIVQECAEVARQHNLEKASRSHMIHKAIKEHFGVDE